MKYKTKLTRSAKTHDSLGRTIDDFKNMNPDPIQEISVGYKFYEELLTDSKDLMNRQKEKLYVTSLWGIKIVIDPELRPNEYKVKYVPK